MKCRYHPELESTHVVAFGPVVVYECDECAEAERKIGAFVVTPIEEEDEWPDVVET